MSAIFGILRFDGGEVSARDLERMCNVLAHRGPDGRKFVVAGPPVGLGHCLMRVNREDLFERQPLQDREAGLTLVADCRIDNREELAGAYGIDAAELRDVPDSALVLRAYKSWGKDCVEHLIGDFAFAIWDCRANELILARDHMGQRSIFYHRARDFFVFATEPSALWAVPDVPRELSETALGRQLLFAPTRAGNATLFKDINHVPGGHIVVVSGDGRVAERRYWQPCADPSWLNRTEAEYVERYRAVLTEAVECRIRRLISPPALCLSGGFDSSAIAGLSGPVLTARGQKLIAVSSVLEEGRDNAENARGWVELCRRHMPHLDVHYVARSHELEFENLARAYVACNGFAGADYNITDILFQEASAAGARLIMDGIGGDATINPRGGGILQYLLRTWQFRRFLLEAAALTRTGTSSFHQILRTDLIAGQVPFWLRRAWRALRHGQKPEWTHRSVAPTFAARLINTGTIDPAEIVVRLRPYLPTRAQMERVLFAVVSRPAHHYASQAAARRLEITRPMLDKRVVEFGRAVPEDLYVKDGRERHLARRALAGIYPPEFATRLTGTETRLPGQDAAVRAALPRLSLEVQRLSGLATLRNYIDFPALERGLARFRDEPAPGSEGAYALRAFHIAKFIEWFHRANA
jgi:asparagine synthase (glutamine-hydrolysing)